MLCFQIIEASAPKAWFEDRHVAALAAGIVL
jgi:hypothetical protein